METPPDEEDERKEEESPAADEKVEIVQQQELSSSPTISTDSEQRGNTPVDPIEPLEVEKQISERMSFTERTFIAVKPDGVQRGLVGEIIRRFERRGLQLVAIKMIRADRTLLSEHYEALAEKPFFNNLMEYMSSGPVSKAALDKNVLKYQKMLQKFFAFNLKLCCNFLWSRWLHKNFTEPIVNRESYFRTFRMQKTTSKATMALLRLKKKSASKKKTLYLQVVAMTWQGLDVVRQARAMLGATNPLQSSPGTIRGDFAIQTGRNVCHGSDSVESAEREIALWFTADELNDYPAADHMWIYEWPSSSNKLLPKILGFCQRTK